MRLSTIFNACHQDVLQVFKICKQNIEKTDASHNQRLPGACNRSSGSKLLSITMQLHCGGHLGGGARLPNTILEKDHPCLVQNGAMILQNKMKMSKVIRCQTMDTE